MPVRKEYAFEAVVRHAAGYIQHKMQHVLHGDVDRPRHVHVMFLEPVGDRGQEEYFAIRAPCRLFANRGDNEIVNIQGEMLAMVFNRPDG